MFVLKRLLSLCPSAGFYQNVFLTKTGLLSLIIVTIIEVIIADRAFFTRITSMLVILRCMRASRAAALPSWVLAFMQQLLAHLL